MYDFYHVRTKEGVFTMVKIDQFSTNVSEQISIEIKKRNLTATEYYKYPWTKGDKSV